MVRDERRSIVNIYHCSQNWVFRVPDKIYYVILFFLDFVVYRRVISPFKVDASHNLETLSPVAAASDL